MKFNDLLCVAPAATQFAEGWLSAGHSGLFWSGWHGARYQGYPFWQRPIKAVVIAKDMQSRGLFRGFNIHSLDTQQTIKQIPHTSENAESVKHT